MDRAMQNRAAAAAEPAIQLRKTKGKKKKKKAKAKAKGDGAANPSILDISPIVGKEHFVLEVYRNMSSATLRFLSGVRKNGALKDAELAFGTNELRFQHRFAPFRVLLRPPPLSYDDYLKTCDYSKHEAGDAVFFCVCMLPASKEHDFYVAYIVQRTIERA